MKRKSVIFNLLITSFLLFSCKTEEGNKKKHPVTFYENPVYSNGADPSIIRDRETGLFYAYPTSSKFAKDGEELSQKVGPILESSDLVHWTYKGSVFDSTPGWGRIINDGVETKATGMGVWAPDIVYLNNQYYYYYTLGTSEKNHLKSCGIGVCTSSTPYGPWVDHGKVLDGYDVSHYNPIDPCVRQDDDGKIYCFYGSFSGICYIELTADGLGPKYPNEPNFGMVPKFGRYLISDSYEGTYITKMNGSYYFFASGGSCCKGLTSSYYTVVFKSDSLLGEYVDKDGVNAYDSSSAGTVVIDCLTGYAKGTGHISVIQDDDENYYLVYHAYDSLDNNGYRKLMIDKLVFDKQGYPHVENYVSSLGESAVAPYIETK